MIDNLERIQNMNAEEMATEIVTNLISLVTNIHNDGQLKLYESWVKFWLESEVEE